MTGRAEMRVTTSQAQRSQLEYIQSNLQRLVKSQDQAATGKRFQRGSEDPAATADVLRADGTLASYAQYTRNTELAIGRADAEDRVLNNVQLITERARELASQQSGSTADAATRLIAKTEVDQLIDAAVGLGNTRYDNGYLLGGTRSAQVPMANTPNSTPPYTTATTAPGNPQFEIASGQLSAPNHNAHEIFVDTNVMVALRDLSTALGANNRYETIRLERAEATVDTKARRSMLYDIDLSEAAANFAQAQSAYQAALSAANRVINLNILDYLR
jgi:flagellar hook-associated protein 3 FlgL